VTLLPQWSLLNITAIEPTIFSWSIKRCSEIGSKVFKKDDEAINSVEHVSDVRFKCSMLCFLLRNPISETYVAVARLVLSHLDLYFLDYCPIGMKFLKEFMQLRNNQHGRVGRTLASSTSFESLRSSNTSPTENTEDFRVVGYNAV
jgi:hypothetical protein